jgi:hypothetical protein
MMVEGIANTKVRRGSGRWRLGNLVALVVLLGAVSVPASANPVTFDFIESNPSPGVFQYDYTVNNTGEFGPGADIFEVFFELSPGTVLSNSNPTDWDSIVGSTFVDSFSLIPGGSDIPAGSSLAGFGFTLDSEVDIHTVPFFVLFTNAEDHNGIFDDHNDENDDPLVNTPEPATLVLVGSSIVGFLSRRKFQGSTQQT